MRKEYSDLSDRQKLIYIKRSAIYWGCSLIPMFIVLGTLFSVLISYSEAVRDLPEDNAVPDNSTATETKTSQSSIWAHFFFIFLMVMGATCLIGITVLGFTLSEWVANKLHLYTDFELESAERKVAEIKKVMPSEASAPKEP